MMALSVAQRETLDQEGYLVVESVFDPLRDIEPALSEYAQVLDDIATRFLAEGLIGDTYRSLPFTQRLMRICRESGRSVSQYFDISLPQTGVRPDTPIHLGPALFGC